MAAQLEWEVKSGLSDLAPLCVCLQGIVGLSVCICSPLPRPHPNAAGWHLVSHGSTLRCPLRAHIPECCLAHRKVLA